MSKQNRWRRFSWSRFSRARFIVSIAAALVVCAGLIVYARAVREARGAYALANDLPRGALVYAQCADLPALVKRWEESTLKQQLVASTSFQQFANRHLALKLVERWSEYNDALGFTLDAGALAGASQSKAALAIYDIGRLDLVFIAPLTEEQSAAADFFTHTDGFDEVQLPDGPTYYRREADVDNGREHQVLAFAWARGRFVLATNERLLLRTLANINGRAQKDRLADDPAFQTLSRELGPHFATVWVDQSALNRDWYFKSYWVQQNVKDLQTLRAGLFDLELQEHKWIEHRRFLLSGQTTRPAPLPAGEAQRLAALMPTDAPYYKVRALTSDEGAANTLRDTLFDRPPQDDPSGRGPNWSWHAYDNSDFEESDKESDYGSGYEYLDHSYDRLIDDPVDARLQANDARSDGELRAATEAHFVAALAQVLQPARPLYAATSASPQVNRGPLFVEFRRAAALTLAAPARFDRAAFEHALADLAQSRLAVAGATAALQWTDTTHDGRSWRTLELPVLGRQLCYRLDGRELLVANSAELLQAISTTHEQTNPHADVAAPATLDELTVVRFDQRGQAFDQIFARLDAQRIKAYWAEHRGKENDNKDEASAPTDAPQPSEEFFSGNIASLLDVAARVRAVEISRSHQPGRLREEIELIFN
jgi:hypothetical protein